MPRTGRDKSFRQRNLLSPQDVDALFPEPVAEREIGAIVEFPISDLWFDDQPRQIIPDAMLSQLIARGESHPENVLAILDEIAATNRYYRGVRDALADLATTIAAEGVLEPLLVVERDGRHVVRDGHRRTLASLIAKLTVVPIRTADETSDVLAVARQLVVNLQRQDLTALEKGRWLMRLATLVEEQLRRELNVGEGPSVVESLINQREDDDAEPSDAGQPSASTAHRELAGQIRKRVCDLTGLSQRHYYNFMYLNRLTPEARDAGVGLTEGQLRPVTSLPAQDQAEITTFIAQRNLTAKEAQSLAQVVRGGDRDAVRRVMAQLSNEQVGRQRTSVSWEVLLHAVPKDLWVRCASLRAELGALPPNLREVRLKTLWEQRNLAVEMQRAIDEICDVYGYAGSSNAEESPLTDVT